jgi:hypothetical protein
MPLISVVEKSISKVRNPFRLAQLNRPCKQRIRNSLVMVRYLRIQLQDRRDIAAINQLQKADQLVLEIGADEVTAIKECTVIASNFFK